MTLLVKCSEKANTGFGHSLAQVWSSVLQGRLTLSHFLLSVHLYLDVLLEFLWLCCTALLPAVNSLVLCSIDWWQKVRKKRKIFSKHGGKMRLILFRWLNVPSHYRVNELLIRVPMVPSFLFKTCEKYHCICVWRVCDKTGEVFLGWQCLYSQALVFLSALTTR